jgi:hypothetical protein
MDKPLLLVSDRLWPPPLADLPSGRLRIGDDHQKARSRCGGVARTRGRQGRLHGGGDEAPWERRRVGGDDGGRIAREAGEVVTGKRSTGWG